MPYTPVLLKTTADLPQIAYDIRYGNSPASPDSSENDPVHIHDFFEAYINLSGDVSFLVDDILYKVKRGDMIISRTNQLHMCVYNAASQHEYYCLWIKKGWNGLSFVDAHFPTKLSFRGKEAEQLFALLAHLKEADSELEQTSALLHVLCEIKRFGLLVKKDSCAEPKLMFDQILSYIDQAPGDISNVHQLCAHFFISRSTINRMFEKNLKLSPKKYLIYKKLAYAKKLLSSGESVENTAFLCGFPDASRFIVVFKNSFGITPNVYRKNGL